MAALKISSSMSSFKIDERKIIPHLIMSFGLWIMYWFYRGFEFYDNLLPLTFVAGVFISVSSSEF
jgi:ABC-2 type transport system permease protein